MKKILICGDSFSADYSIKDSSLQGWVNFLAKDYSITNLSDAGSSEYRILKKLESANLDDYQGIIICHTSPFRVYIKEHPVYKDDVLHKNCDLIYSDIEYHCSKTKNRTLSAAKNYFEQIFDDEYYKDVYFLIQDKILELVKNHKCLHLTPLFDEQLYKFKHYINLHAEHNIEINSVNHYSAEDNKKIYYKIKTWIENNV